MNHETFEFLLAIFVFDTLPQANQELLHSIMLMPTETMSTEAVTADGVVPEMAMATKGASSEVAPTKIPIEVPKLPQSPRPRPTPTKDIPKNKKGKQAAHRN